MLGRSKKKKRDRRSSSATAAALTRVGEFVAPEHAPDLKWLHDEGGGPYYIAPDSAPALPRGMWSELNPEDVENAAAEVDKLLGADGWDIGKVDGDIRRSVADDGELGARVIELLEGEWGSAGGPKP